MKYNRKGRINVVAQFGSIASLYKDIIVEKWHCSSKYYIRMRIKPSLISNNYQIKMQLEQNNYPQIFVENPNIYDECGGRRPPHVYEFSDKVCRICLFMAGEVKLSEFYDKVVPWISEWLIHYEIWRITVQWNGGGHVGSKKTDKS